MKNQAIKLGMLFISLGSMLQLKAQLPWVKMDSAFQHLPSGFHVYRLETIVDSVPLIAWYAEADLRNKQLNFTADTSSGRRLTPAKFFEKNNQPLLVVNTTFFSFATNKSLNVVVRNKKMLAHNQQSIGRKSPTGRKYAHVLPSSFNIYKKGIARIEWGYSDENTQKYYVVQRPVTPMITADTFMTRQMINDSLKVSSVSRKSKRLRKAKPIVAIGGGPVILRNNEVFISNKEELKFSGATGLTDRHPRTMIGFTADHKVIVMVVQGRMKGLSEGATLPVCAMLMKSAGCTDALNLDGGGSSCMLIEGKETIKPSDSGGQRPVPAVFIIRER